MKAIQYFLILALLGVCSGNTSAFQAIEQLHDTQLSTPRRAIHAFVHWQQQGHENYGLFHHHWFNHDHHLGHCPNQGWHVVGRS